MKWLFGIAFLLLAGCASFVNPISQTQVYQLENAYGVAQSAAVAYTNLPRCTVGVPLNICSQHVVIVQLAQADQSARVALTAAENFVRSNPTLSPASVISAAQTAIGVLVQIEANYNIPH